MSRYQQYAAELVVRDGQPITASPYLFGEAGDDFCKPGTEHILIILEPMSHSSSSEELASEVSSRLRAEIKRRSQQAPTAALMLAIETTNRWLVQANAIRPALERARFGLTCVLSRGDDIYIAQAAPSQILISQEGELYAFPGLDSWDWQQAMGETSGDYLIGVHDEIEPDLYHTRVEAGDLIVLCSTSLARLLDREPQDVFVHGDADAAMAFLGNLADSYEIGNAGALTVAVSATSSSRYRVGNADYIQKFSNWCYNLLPEETAERFRRRSRSRAKEVDLKSPSMHTLEYPDQTAMPGSEFASETWEISGGDTSDFVAIDTFDFADTEFELENQPSHHEDDYYRDPHGPDEHWVDDSPEPVGKEKGRTLTELLAGAILALSAAFVGVWQIAVNRDRTIRRPPKEGTVGLPRLNRYDASVHMPDMTGVRRRLPRAPISRLTALIAIALIVAVAAAGVFTIRSNAQRDREERIEAALQTVVSQRQQSLETSDPATAHAFLLAAQASLVDAEQAGLDPTQVSQERAAIQAGMDQVLKVDRLANIQVLGGITPAPEGVTPRIFFGNGQLYVFTDALYRLDSNTNSLIRLLGSGDQVGEATTGTLLGAGWGDGAPIVFDGSSAYLFDATAANWSAHPVGTFGSPFEGVATASGYAGNLYLLTPETGQILRFSAGNFDSVPEDWTGGLAAEELASATDMVIDGRIYTLLADGRILNFYMSALESTTTPNVTPAIKNAVALEAQPDRPYFYVADEHDRLLRLSREDGQLVQQFMAEPDNPALDNIRDIAVDDVLGSAYVLTDEALVLVRIPGPPR